VREVKLRVRVSEDGTARYFFSKKTTNQTKQSFFCLIFVCIVSTLLFDLFAFFSPLAQRICC